MKKIYSTVLLTCLFPMLSWGFSFFSDSEATQYFSKSSAEIGMVIDHGEWNRILQTYIVEKDGINFFRYEEVTEQDRQSLADYLANLESLEVINLTAEQQFAYWINFYNGLTISVILDHYPLASIKDISYGFGSRGPWKEKLVSVAGIRLGLDDIEHEILRPVFLDNRIHYAVNCASIGCPNLQKTAFTALNLESLLDSAAHQYINHHRGVEIIDDELVLSSIFDWYADDFGENDSEVIEQIGTYAEPRLAARLKNYNRIDGYRYDWSLNGF